MERVGRVNCTATRAWRPALGAAALIVAAAACGEPTGDEATLAAGGVTIVTQKPDRDTPEAGVEGVVVFDREAGCVRLGQNAAIWPSGSTLVESPLELQLPGGRAVRDGHRVAGRGGEVRANRKHLRTITDSDIDAVMRCSRGGLVVLVAEAHRVSRP